MTNSYPDSVHDHLCYKNPLSDSSSSGDNRLEGTSVPPRMCAMAISKFDQDFDRFMNGLENFEPFDDLEEWSDNVELFMDVMAKPTEHADALWELAKIKKRKSQGSRTIQRLNL